MQKEHLMYALSGLAVEVAEHGFRDFAEILIEMTLNEAIPERLAQLVTQSDEDELVQFLIEERIKEEARARRAVGVP